MNQPSDFWVGLRRGFTNALPFALVIIPFGALFGVIATEAGLNIAQVMGFSILVIAGASQITAVSLMADNAPTVIVLATALAVNLRMGMYSAALLPAFGPLPLWKRAFASFWLFDQPFALTTLDQINRPERSVTERYGFYLGVAFPMAFLWYLSTYLGAILGEQIPSDIRFDVAIPATFLALIAPALRSIPHLAAALTSIIGTLTLHTLPFNSGLLVSALLALVVGVEVERRFFPKKTAEAKS